MDSYNRNESQMYLVKWKKLEPKDIILYDSIYMDSGKDKIIEMEDKSVAARSRV